MHKAKGVHEVVLMVLDVGIGIVGVLLEQEKVGIRNGVGHFVMLLTI